MSFAWLGSIHLMPASQQDQPNRKQKKKKIENLGLDRSLFSSFSLNW